MKTTGRLALFGLFVSAGVGLAVCIGTSPRLPEQKHPSRPVELTAVLKAEPLPSDLDSRAQSTAAEPSEAASTSAANSASTASVTVEPNPPYAQETLPPPNEVVPPKVMDVLSKGLADSQAAPPPTPSPPAAPQAIPPPIPSAPPATPPVSKTSIDTEGDGKLRIQFRDADIREALNFLSEQGGLNILASKNVEGKVSATLNGVDIETALRAILRSTGFTFRRDGNFIFVGTPEEFNSMEQGQDRVGTRVYRTNYITAAELKALVVPLLTEKIGIVSVSSPAEAGIATSDAGAGGDKFSGGEVLVARDYEAVLSQIDQLVTEVDVRPMQVAIDAMILSVHLTDEDQFGVNFQLLRANPDIKFGLGAPPTSLSDLAPPAGFPLTGGLKFGFLDGNLGAFLQALEQIGDTTVISNPHLLVLNKQRAEIQVGEKQGYVNQTVTETSSTSSVEFLDTGTQLRVRPFISSDGLVRMEVHPELSDGTVVLTGGFTLPNKNITQTTTNVMVRDGCTVVIGGLIHEQLENTTTQVPVLGNLPLVGFAFRQTDEKIERREIIVLITPRIVYEPGSCQEAQKSACEFIRRQNTYADKMSPFGKRSIARRYYRLAETAYANGQCKKALWFAEMAVQFDPLNRAALELRTNIWQGKPYELAGSSDQTSPIRANPLEGQTMPDWLINDLANTNTTPESPIPMHPLDPGVPGRHLDLVRPKVLQ